MKTKWLIILSLLFLGIIILSFLITQKNQTVVLVENEIIITPEVEGEAGPVYLPQKSLASITRISSKKSGITITKAPLAVSSAKTIPALKIADKTQNNLINQNIVSNQDVVESSDVQDNPQVGITKLGKRPTPKEAQEMNSSGVVMY